MSMMVCECERLKCVIYSSDIPCVRDSVQSSLLLWHISGVPDFGIFSAI